MKTARKYAIPATALLFGALAAAALCLHMSRISAAPFRPADDGAERAPRDVVFAVLSPEAVRKTWLEISAFGSRAPGQPGLDATRDYLVSRFKAMGLETFVQDVSIPYPLLKPGSGHIDGDGFSIQAWPLSPNYAQPVTTGPDGLSGELFTADDASMRSCKDFGGKIAVIDLAAPIFAEFGLNPIRYIGAGFLAVVYTHSDGLESIDWDLLHKSAVQRGLPMNIVRVAAPPEILGHAGETVRIDSVSIWREAKTQNVVAVLRAPEPGGRALVMPVQYDAASVLPDFASGSLEAYQAAVLVQTAEALSAVGGYLKRDVVFAATTGLGSSHAGSSRLYSTLGTIDRREQPARRIAAEIAENDSRLAALDQIEALFAEHSFAMPGHAKETSAAVRSLPMATRRFLSERFSAAMRAEVFAQNERQLKARVAFQRHPYDLDSEDFRAFRREKAVCDRINTLAGLPLHRAADEANGLLDPRAILRSHLAHLREYHATRRDGLAVDSALASLFARYGDIAGLSPRLAPPAEDTEKIGFSPGYNMSRGEAYDIFRTMTEDSISNLGLDDAVSVVGAPWDGFARIYTFELDSLPLCALSYPAHTVVTAEAQPHSSLYPFRDPRFASEAPEASLRVFADVAATMACSSAPLPRLPAQGPFAVRGSVFASGVGSSVIPNFAVEGALVCSGDRKQPMLTNPYGEYDIPFALCPAFHWQRYHRYDAFFFDSFGLVSHAKDYGPSAQSIYDSSRMVFDYRPVNEVLYRASPVAVLDPFNPQSLKVFSGFTFLDASTLAAFPSTSQFYNGDGLMDFVQPDKRFYLVLKAGAPQNELVSTIREFTLAPSGGGAPDWRPSGAEIDGPGYLAADTPYLRDLSRDAFASMSGLDGKRLALQRRHGIADELSEAFADKAETTAGDGGGSALERRRRLRQGLSYLVLNHPAVRGTISEAVFGIVWYLGLLVPFAFFLEKLLFDFADARKQVVAQSAIFLAAFAMLRLLHPAFLMIRSSAMILLGFAIVIVVLSVMALLYGKFGENLDALRRAGGRVSGAEANRSGIVLTAFMLGLNNMHRRKVRTGLTCATLVLMTFVMVCFTSVSSNVIDTERATGRASYQGIVVRNDAFFPLSQAETSALVSEFGARHPVCRRTIYTGWHDSWRQALRSPEFRVSTGEGDAAHMRVARAALGFDPSEPLAASIRMLCTNGWFSADGQPGNASDPKPVILSDIMAEQLGLTREMVESSKAEVTIDSVPFFVQNIFDSASLESVADPDGHDLLAFDAETLAMTRFGPQGAVLADDTATRIPAAETILVQNNAIPGEPYNLRTASAAIDMGGAPYSAARAEIVSYLERSGRECRYALGGSSFVGRRSRARSATGYLELLIPLAIAALTVLNTMKGSVYERQNEIFVYNAVGIAPKSVFFIFIAESLVYAVVGAVLGYIMSLGAGKLAAAFLPTLAAGMNFTSATCVHASIAIAAATLLSTWYPARTAMRMAKPADNSGWSLPAPDADDCLRFTLPFTFTPHDRIAVLAFFARYFDGFGEGGAGPFFAGEPSIGIADRTDPLAGGAPIPALEVRVWLKPFDLGVSQSLEIALATDPETREFIASVAIRRITGTRDAWLRLNRPFVALLRRRFLHWRAVGPEEKTELFAAARTSLLNH